MPNRNTGFTPNMMMLGREILKPADIIFNLVGNKQAAVGELEYVKKLRKTLERVHEIERKNLQAVQKRQKRTYDLKMVENSFEVGDLVLKLKAAGKVGQSRKLNPGWEGPFLVIEVISPVLYKIQSRKKEGIVHHDMLKLCQDQIIPLWMRRRRHRLLDLDETIAYDEQELEDDEERTDTIDQMLATCQATMLHT